MSEIEDYTIQETLYESDGTRIYRAMDSKQSRSVIIKRLIKKHPTAEDLENFSREYNILQKLKCDTVIQAYDLSRNDNAPVIIMEDIGGETLSSILMVGELRMEEFLNLGLRICRTVGDIHQAGIIHRDINPSNIIWNIEKDIIRIIDFSVASDVARERTSVKNPNMLAGTLAFMSPEQTGWTNRYIDYRTDFYSLGVTFYRMLTRRLPFSETDPYKLVHNHIVVQPQAPHILDPRIPEAISGIVMKLMSKNAEDRYLDARGLEADLEQCRKSLQENGTIETFILGSKDVSDTFQIPQKLYGREKETDTLKSVFDRVRQGHRELVCISGPAGIGKSSLVNEMRRGVFEQGGYFISGKIEEIKRSIPYGAFIDAFGEMARQILTESDSKIDKFKKKILSAVKPNGKIITDMIPDFESIMGKQPELIPLDPVESQNRFNLVLSTFVREVSDEENPLVIFLDDLQWVDPASLSLLKLFAEDIGVKHLMLIVAYRHDEVSSRHPLMITLNSLDKNRAMVKDISLESLTPKDISQLLSETMDRKMADTMAPAKLVVTKAKGNPFFIIEFLKALYKRGTVQFSREDGWQWDIAEIDRMQVTDNVVELMTSKINVLPEHSQKSLKLAACIGNTFTLERLSRIAAKPETDLKPAIYDLLQAEMLVKIDQLYRFSHDRIREAAYLLISDEDRARHHFFIGNMELSQTSVENLEERVFFIVNHLNAGIAMVTEHSEKYNLVQLNLMAGRRAMASNAYTSALDYFTAGIRLLDEDTWKTEYDLTLALYHDAATASQLSAEYTMMTEFVQEVLQNARTIMDTIKVHEAEILACMDQNQIDEAIRIGLNTLNKMDFNLPENPGRLRVKQEFQLTRKVLKGMSIDQLKSLPKMNDPKKLGMMRVLAGVMSAAYHYSPELLAVLVFNSVRLSVLHGNSRYSPYAYAAFGMIHCGVLDDIDKGYEWGKLAMELVEKEDLKKVKSKVWIVIWFLINTWKRPLQDSMDPLHDAYEAGLETGDLEFAANAGHLYTWFLLVSGTELTHAENEIAQFADTIRQFKQDDVLHYQLMTHQFVLNLQGKSDDPCRLEGASYDMDKMLPLHIEANSLTALSLAYYYSLFLNYMFGDYYTAYEYSQKDGPCLMKVGVSSYYIPLYNFYDSLVMLALYPEAEKSEQKKYLAQIRQNQKKMKKWADHAPENYLNKFHLVEAETARVLGQEKDARHHYSLAAEYAAENRLLNEEALALELTAKFWLGTGEEKIAASYFKEAHRRYRTWGAVAKVNQITENYHGLIKEYTVDTRRSTDSPMTETIDLPAIINTVQSLSSETDLSELLKTITTTAIVNAGAKRGVVILSDKEGGGLSVRAEGEANKQAGIVESIPLEGNTMVPEKIVAHVHQTGQQIILNNACKTGEFTDDTYIKENEVKSLLCLPMHYKEEKVGILYLENNPAGPGVTPQRIEILSILSAQAAISIRNARMYAILENSVREKNEALAAASKEINELVLKDPLTSLRNRRYIYEYVADLSENFLKTQTRLLHNDEKRNLNAKNKVFGVFLIDIDHFKVVNDTYGSQAGDRVLIRISEILKKLIRMDDILVRWGGKEFLVILINTSPDYIDIFLKKVMDAVQKTKINVTDEKTLHKTCSVGCVKMPLSSKHPEFLTLEQTINVADFGLYIAKENGRNRSVSIELKDADKIDDGMRDYLTTLSKKSEINFDIIKVRHISQ